MQESFAVYPLAHLQHRFAQIRRSYVGAIQGDLIGQRVVGYWRDWVRKY